MTTQERYSRGIQRWQHFLNTSDWKELVVPVLQEQVEYFLRMLRSPMSMRSPKLPDDYIRGTLDMAEFLLTWPQDNVNSALADAAQEIMARQLETLYPEGAETGSTPDSEE